VKGFHHEHADRRRRLPTASREAEAKPLRADEEQILDRWTGKSPATQARIEGSSLVLDSTMSEEAARRRMHEMTEQGLAPKGTPHDMARSDPSTFRASDALRGGR
jgi:hypothetical protein